MNKAKDHITVFEHESIRFDKGEKRITEDQFKALQSYYGAGVPYYSLRYNGVQFNEYVGVIQVGSTLIEVLPKADKSLHTEPNETKWRSILIGMLKAVNGFDIKSTSDSHLKIKPNTILDLYFEMLVREVEFLLHRGLVKQYRKKEGNVLALKGSLQFGKQIQQNLTHQERFFVRHTTYDVTHKLHFILYKALKLLYRINTNAGLKSRIGALMLHFPDMPDIIVSESTFDSIVYDRKSLAYKKAIEISKLILLQYHPDISKGRNHVLALMFDMNVLWESFVYLSLKKHTGWSIKAQATKNFWKPDNGYRSKIVPDIWISMNGEHYILDTKWKNLNGSNPSPDDLRQMYVYHEYYAARKVALIYPGERKDPVKGRYISCDDNISLLDKECSIITLSVEANIKVWQKQICTSLDEWIQVVF